MSTKKVKKERTIEQQIRIRTIRSFFIFGVLITAAIFAWRWLYHSPGTTGDAQIHAPLRKAEEMNESVFSRFFSKDIKVRTYPASAAVKNVRVNGMIGLGNNFKYENWKLHVVKSPGDTLLLDMKDIVKHPRTDIVFDFKCIEGWDQVTHWGGLRFSDFIQQYHLEEQSKKKYVGLETPDGKYYVGIDMASMMQSQTMLCYLMNNQFLPMNQGFPLRLIIPVKYGIKHLKRIGTICFSDTPPRDYWAEQGYDYYSGH